MLPCPFRVLPFHEQALVQGNTKDKLFHAPSPRSKGGSLAHEKAWLDKLEDTALWFV